MTTIVYSHKEKVIAVDSRMTANSMIKTDAHRKAHFNELGLWFFSGQTPDLPKVIRSKHGDEIKADEFEVLRVKDRIVFRGVQSNGVYKEEIVDYDICCGSGSEFAIAALDLGKSAREAVEYAKTRDYFSGGKVLCFRTDGQEIDI